MQEIFISRLCGLHLVLLCLGNRVGNGKEMIKNGKEMVIWPEMIWHSKDLSSYRRLDYTHCFGLHGVLFRSSRAKDMTPYR